MASNDVVTYKNFPTEAINILQSVKKLANTQTKWPTVQNVIEKWLDIHHICLNKSGKEKQWLGRLFYWAITKLVKNNMWENYVVTWRKIMRGEKEKQDLELYIRYDYNNVFKDGEETTPNNYQELSWGIKLPIDCFYPFLYFLNTGPHRLQSLH